jgi:recombination protein RecT
MNQHVQTQQQGSDQRTALVKIKDKIGGMEGEFKKTLPAHITSDKFVRSAQTAIFTTRNIDKVTDMNSFVTEVAKAAQDGLILDGREAALVIDHKGRARYTPMVRGLLKLAHNSGAIKGMVVEVVRKGDKFTHKPTNLVEPVTHEINHEDERGEVFAVYALVELMTGGLMHEVMNIKQINAIRDRSDGWKAFKDGKIKSTPWSTDPEEMSRKTVFRRISKYLPSSSDRLESAVSRMDDDYSFEADADEQGNISTPQPKTKQRGAGASILKNITPEHEQSRRDEQQGAQPRQPAQRMQAEDYDLQTGELIDASQYDRGGYHDGEDDRGPSDDF